MLNTLTVTEFPSKPVKTTLSSNWKQLQKTLKRKSPESSSKATKTSSKPETTRPAKRQRKEDGHAVQIKSKSKMSSSSKSPSTPTSASLAIWAEDNDISPTDLAAAYGVPTSANSFPSSSSSSSSSNNNNNPKSTEIGRYVAIDCEMVGVGGPDHERSVLARVSIVNFYGHCVLDVFVKPQERVTDWRTWVSGVSPKNMVDAVDFATAQRLVSDVLKGRILVGHSIKHDLDVLLLSQSHPKRDIRDTSKHADFRKISKGKTPGLKRLAKEILGIDIQGGEHSSIEDAGACMLLYRRFKPDFEKQHALQYPPTRTKNQAPLSKTAKMKKRKEQKAAALVKKVEDAGDDDGEQNLASLLEI